MTSGIQSTRCVPDPPGPGSVSLPRRPVAKFSQKAQCEPWTGQDGPGGLRAKTGARGRGSACLAAFHGPVWGGDPDGDRPAPKSWPD